MTPEVWDRAYAAKDLTWSVQPHPHLAGAVRPGAGRALDPVCGEGRQAI